MAEGNTQDEFEELLGEDHDADFPLEEEQAAPDGEVGKGPQKEGAGEQKGDAAGTPKDATDNNDLLGQNEDTVDGLLDDYDHEDFFGEGDQQDGQGQAAQGEGPPEGQHATSAAAREGATPPGTSAGLDGGSSVPLGAADLGIPPSSSSSGGSSLQGHVMHPLGPAYTLGRNTQQGMGEAMRGGGMVAGVSVPMHSAGALQPAAPITMRAGLAGLPSPSQPRQGQGALGGGVLGRSGSVGGGELDMQGGRGGGPGGAALALGSGILGAGRGAGRRGGAGRGVPGGLSGGGEGGYLGGVFSDGFNPAAVSAALMVQGGGWGGKLAGGQIGRGEGGPPASGGLPLQPPSLPGAAGMHLGSRPPHLPARPLGSLPQGGTSIRGAGPGLDVGGGVWGGLEGRPRAGGLTVGQSHPLMQTARPPTHKWVRPELAAAAAASGVAVEEMEQQQTQQQKVGTKVRSNLTCKG
ncbi:hypothetical protein DUNSADRAFT_752 [Dunaliella salina]|uniref:Uncharacterized protein n=1 Tax=Dunaliella salina TaxID=3046 RepID=A0ABQ7GXY5_DUNSA|nr:hypothetical protein DUNSADRAFT_752 [Dunaliella salina]|eukprot:KAF5839466.1 hypothetical protein DUNSADRAFT_752 [Dunaliella salina]